MQQKTAQRFGLFGAVWLCVLISYSLSAAYISRVPKARQISSLSISAQWICRKVYYVGMWAPNVFNSTDLKMGSNWVTLERSVSGSDDSWTQVPLNDIDGGRRWYHLSDRLYFGNHLGWRRTAINVEPDLYHEQKRLKSDLDRMLLFDFRRFVTGEASVMHYRINFYHNDAANFDKSLSERMQARSGLRFVTRIAGDELEGFEWIPLPL